VLSQVYSSAIFGVDAYLMEIEVNYRQSPRAETVIVGLPDAAVKESKDRVLTALANAGFIPVHGVTTINLAPADIKKEGPSFDLPIALGLLASTGQLRRGDFDNYIVVGELALNGAVRPVKGVLPIAVCARDSGKRGVIVPAENAPEASVVEGIEVHGVSDLLQAAALVEGKLTPQPAHTDLHELFEDSRSYPIDLSDVKGQAHVKRALEVAVAGGHNMLMIGPPGAGKSMLAKCIPTILPEMTLEEALETTKIHSIVGLLTSANYLIATRPFRSPHHTISNAGLIGGGSFPKPGEVSLAHNGVLFLDELPEFRRDALEVLREPLEEGKITISRALGSLTFPASFMLAAAMNPCPCGYFTDQTHACRCTPRQIQSYINKISGPLLDRIDIHVDVPALKYREIATDAASERSGDVQRRANAARRFQRERFKRDGQLAQLGLYSNAAMTSRVLRKYCRPDEPAQQLLKTGMNELGISARAYDRILKVARTIADIEAAGGDAGDAADGSNADPHDPTLRAHHISEAIQYRTLDRKLWL